MKEVFIEEESGNGDLLWQRVDDALQKGCRVWVRTTLLESLDNALGRLHSGKWWLIIHPINPDLSHRLVRARDVLLSCLALACLSPLLLVVAILIKFTSSGPIFYSTHVVGEGRKAFLWRKFRSMKVMDEKSDSALRQEKFREYVENRQANLTKSVSTKTIDHERVTPIGRIIRKFSVDELPQLWNVICGQMSLVGPRPCLPYEADFYTGWRSRRFNIRPGLTGIWQVFGRSRTTFDEAAAMDVFYVYRRSFWFDLYLMLKTLGVVLTGRGAR